MDPNKIEPKENGTYAQKHHTVNDKVGFWWFRRVSLHRLSNFLSKIIPFYGIYKAYAKPKVIEKVQDMIQRFKTFNPQMIINSDQALTGVDSPEAFKAAIEDRAYQIIEKVKDGQALFLDFSNRQHSALLIRTPVGDYHYFSFGMTTNYWQDVKTQMNWEQTRPHDVDPLTHDAHKRLVQDIIEMEDYIDEEAAIVIDGLDTQKMVNRANKLMENQTYSGLHYNCARFAADVMKSGWRKVHGAPKPHGRFQMPSDSLVLAEALQKVANTSTKMDDALRDADSLNALMELHNTSVIQPKKSWRYQLKQFLYAVFGYKTHEVIRIKQLEKGITQKIIGDSGIKQSLIDQLNEAKDDGNDERITELLKYLRLNNQSIERLIKLDDEDMLKFYLDHFDHSLTDPINTWKDTPLLWAIRNNAYSLLDRLISEEQLLPRDKDGNTPLILAAKKGNIEAVLWCLGVNKDCTKDTNKYGKSALDMAIKYNHPVVAQRLQQHEQQYR